jgi:hypothetical protein
VPTPGVPPYYSWRTRSGCYFCFFQRKIEWVGLKEHHPDLFEEAKRYEKVDPATGDRYTWSQSESLEELERAERVAKIREEHLKSLGRPVVLPNRPLHEIIANTDEDDDDDEQPCLICHL